MTNTNKREFEALYQLRKRAEKNVVDEREREDIKKDYLMLIKSLCVLFRDDEDDRIDKETEKEEIKERKKIEDNLQKNFPSISLECLTKELCKKFEERNKLCNEEDKIKINFWVWASDEGKIKIYERNSDETKGDLLRVYDDENDYFINIDEDVKVNFKRQKWGENVAKLKDIKED